MSVARVVCGRGLLWSFYVLFLLLLPSTFSTQAQPNEEYALVRVTCIQINALPADLLDGDGANLHFVVFVSDGNQIGGRFAYFSGDSRTVRVGDRLCSELEANGAWFAVNQAQDEVAVWFLAVDTDRLDQLAGLTVSGANDVIASGFEFYISTRGAQSVLRGNIFGFILGLLLDAAVGAWEEDDLIGQYSTVLSAESGWEEDSRCVVSEEGNLEVCYEVILTNELPPAPILALNWREFLNETSTITDAILLVAWLNARPEKVDSPYGGATLITASDEAAIFWTSSPFDVSLLGNSVIPYLVNGSTTIWIVLPGQTVTIPVSGSTIRISGYSSEIPPTPLQVCPGRVTTGPDNWLSLQLNVPEGYVQYLIGSRFDDVYDGVLVRVEGPYVGSHSLYNGMFCEPVPLAVESETREQALRELAFGGQTCEQGDCPIEVNLPSSRPPFTRTLQVIANQENGIVFECPSTGTYIIRIDGGSYSPWPNGVGGQWRTFVSVYRNSEVIWERNQFGFVAPSNPTAVVGRMESPNNTQQDAVAIGVGLSTSIACQSGEYLRFVTMDERASYADNFGEVTVSITLQS